MIPLRFRRRALDRKQRMLILSRLFVKVKNYNRQLNLTIKRFEKNAESLRNKAKRCFMKGDTLLAKEFIDEANYAIKVANSLRKIQAKLEHLELKIETLMQLGTLTTQLKEAKIILEDLSKETSIVSPMLAPIVSDLQKDISLLITGLNIDDNHVSHHNITIRNVDNRVVNGILREAEEEYRKRVLGNSKI